MRRTVPSLLLLVAACTQPRWEPIQGWDATVVDAQDAVVAEADAPLRDAPVESSPMDVPDVGVDRPDVLVSDVVMVPDSDAALPTWRIRRVLGQPDLRQTAPNQIDPRTFYAPSGVAVDPGESGRATLVYVWDPGNSRVLGFRSLGTCSGSGLTCTESATCGDAGVCVSSMPPRADLVFGQPSMTEGACNGDNTEARAPSAVSLCSVATPLTPDGDATIASGALAVDGSHNLYVLDPYNHRVLRFTDPSRVGVSPDRVWGQADFLHGVCNRGTDPSAESLCLVAPAAAPRNELVTGGLDVTPDGAFVWVADTANHRVLRFPAGASRADLVLGQTSFTERVNGCPDPPVDARLCFPRAVRFDAVGRKLSVLHGYGTGMRLSTFTPPFVNGQSAATVSTTIAGLPLRNARGLTVGTDTADALWITDTGRGRVLQTVGGAVQRLLGVPDPTTEGCDSMLRGDGTLSPMMCAPSGPVSFDREASLYVTDARTHTLRRFRAPLPTWSDPRPVRSPDVVLPSASTRHPNTTGASGLQSPIALGLIGTRLVVAETDRLMSWTSPWGGFTPGVAADAWFPTLPDGERGALTFDGLDAVAAAMGGPESAPEHLWTASAGMLHGWRDLAAAIMGGVHTVVSSPLPVAGDGGTFAFTVTALAVDPRWSAVWVADRARHRVFRIVFSTGTPRMASVDLLLGQADAATTTCNRGDGAPSASTLCEPSGLAFDRDGNLYVIEGSRTSPGNRRVLQFAAADLPAPPSSQLVPGGSLSARRVFGKPGFGNFTCTPGSDAACGPSAVAFDPTTNRMLLLTDEPLSNPGARTWVYDDPTPAGVTAPTPSQSMPWPFMQPVSATGLPDGSFAVLDRAWRRVLIVSPP